LRFASSQADSTIVARGVVVALGVAYAAIG